MDLLHLLVFVMLASSTSEAQVYTNPCSDITPCFNGGVCTDIGSDGALWYQCTCPSGYTGSNCHLSTSTATGCLSNPCQNGAVCQAFTSGAYVCQCNTGFYGVNCQLTYASETCSINQCTNGETCYNRNEPGEADYACECNQPFTSGYNCTVTADNSDIFTCYGTKCFYGFFSSPNYPSNYGARYRALYLIYSPGVDRIDMFFDDLFTVERPKDELYIGAGLSPPDVTELSGQHDASINMFFFDGSQRPGKFSIVSDSVWMYFLTDKNVEELGFRVRWEIYVNPCDSILCQNGGTCVLDSTGEIATCSCLACYIGSFCETAQNACDNHLCQNGGACITVAGSCTAYTCTCPSCYSGSFCERAINACSNNLCQNGGACITVAGSCTAYTCTCPSCYSGSFCERAINACSNNLCQNGGACITVAGSCTAYTCTCPSCYSGSFCETAINACSNNLCQNGGACITVAGSCTAYTCTCPSCYSGSFCERAINACSNNLCQNGGACITVAGSCTAYTCTCPSCYSGSFCETAINACSNNLCQNGGACITVAGSCTAYTCTCPSCYSGSFCETGLNACSNNLCQNAGACNSVAGSCTAYTCTCPSCYSGSFCETGLNACSNNLCQNAGACNSVAGSCTAYTCTCPSCYSGSFCETAISGCSNNLCQNGAVCNAVTGSCSYTCSCSSCYTGNYCETGVNACDDNLCLNEGVCNTVAGSCTAFTCSCATGYSGQLCETASCDVIGDYDFCNSRGQCLYNDSQATCTCQAGFTGSRCETRSLNACTLPVEPGDCSSTELYRRFYYDPTSSTCNSFAYFCAGNANNFESLEECQVNCEEPFNVCESDCDNGGTCIPGGSFVNCLCPECLTGANCSTSVSACDNHQCHGDATCVSLEIPDTCSHYLCMCPPCYYGQYCETELVDICMHSKCENGGTCVAVAGNCILYTCDCPPCFTGSFCQVAVNGCTSKSSTTWQPHSVISMILICLLTNFFLNCGYLMSTTKFVFIE